MPTIQRCYRFRLRPTPEQETLFQQWAGCRRFLWNFFLQRRQAYYRETGKTLSYAAMCRELTLLKQQPDFAFLNECDSQALQQVLQDLCRAYVHFFEGRARFPKRKSKRHTPHAFRIPQRVHVQGDWVSIPKVGLVPVLQHRPMEGMVKSATIKQEPSGKWAITFVCHTTAPDPASGQPTHPAGLDAGLESFVTTSEGEQTPPPRFYRKQERKLRRAQRAFSRKQKGSTNKGKAGKRLSLVHARVRHQRHDWLHKRRRELVHEHDCLCIEYLAVSALTKTKRRGHAKSWQDASWGTFRWMLTYKSEEQGHPLVIVCRWYPSSQECHVCHVRTKLDLSAREWTCGCCHTRHDRDINAALNLLAAGLRTLAGGNPERQNVYEEGVRLPKRKPPSSKQKPSGCEVGSTRL
jgi:putative transposase